MLKEDLLSEFDHHRQGLQHLGAKLESVLAARLGEDGIQYQFTAFRIKDRVSLARKLARPDKTYRRLWDITDLVGLRIATFFEDTIEDVARLVENLFRVDLHHSTDKLRYTDSGRFGYRSLHYVCALPLEQSPHPDFRFEIQIRTALQHAWAEVEHDLGYKAHDAVPELIRRRFNRIASLLEIADQEFVSIRRDLFQYQSTVRAELIQGQALPLDTVSLDSLTQTREVQELDAAVAQFLVRPLTPEPFFPSYLVRMLALADLKTTTAVLRAVAQFSPQLPAFLHPYFDFAKQTLGLESASLESVGRGYALLFITHLGILHGHERSLSKVARLTRLYAELDYAGDQAKAQAVAIQQLACLGPGSP
jgi:ppGpp synthetase/RelA/SpoT-type nucleotidyltranferase